MSFSKVYYQQKSLNNIILIIILLIYLQNIIIECEKTSQNDVLNGPLDQFASQLIEDSKQRYSYLALNGRDDTFSQSSLQNTLYDHRYSQAIELTKFSYLFYHFDKNDSTSSASLTLNELFFPSSKFEISPSTNNNKNNKDRSLIKTSKILTNDIDVDPSRITLKYLNLSSNNLTDSFFCNFSAISTEYTSLIAKFFAPLRLLSLHHNHLTHLKPEYFFIFTFNGSDGNNLEALLLNSNEIKSIHHLTFIDMPKLRYVDLSDNQIMTFSLSNALTYLNIANNKLRALFKTTPLYEQVEMNNTTINETTITNSKELVNSFLSNLRYLYLDGNNNLTCDCGLNWLFDLKPQLNYLDNFKCTLLDYNNTKENPSSSSSLQVIFFKTISNISFLEEECEKMGIPNLKIENPLLEETSKFTMFRWFSKRWFAWTVFKDILPTTTPYPILMSRDHKDDIDSYPR
jgi:hypothetical protein